MPLSKNKTRVNVYLDNDEYKSVSKWCKSNKISISSLYVMLTRQFIENENSNLNTWTLINKPTKITNNNKIEVNESEIINDWRRDDYDPFKALMHNIQNNEYMNGF
ncbi:MAG: hypothetical protein AAGU21_17950 [Solidesulfovibrio sp.]|uniref:hypothetical protein n=1 Tax=Solidesulfovibrio sp. TaxID=2910990 RepID=UPI003159694A